MRKELDLQGYRRQLAGNRRSAWRFEQQPSYWLGYERAQFEKFLAGDPESPADNPDLQSWFDRVRGWVADGRTIGRVRVVDEPPTDYQRWMQWMDRWNRDAGETIQYLTRAAAVAAKVIPQAGAEDWWLFDDERIVLTHFDELGRPVRYELIEGEPDVIDQAIRWRAWAVAAANRESAALA
jgi:hypothetical protein